MEIIRLSDLQKRENRDDDNDNRSSSSSALEEDEIRVCNPSESVQRNENANERPRPQSRSAIVQFLSPMFTPFHNKSFNDKDKRRGFLNIFIILALMHGINQGYIEGIFKHLDEHDEAMQYLMGLNDIVAGTVAVIFSFHGNRSNRMRYLGAAVMCQSIIGIFIAAVDTAAKPMFLTNNSTDITCVSPERIKKDQETSTTTLRIILMIYTTVSSLTTISFATIGISYMDDFFKYDLSPFLLGLVLGIIELGRYFGLMFSWLPTAYGPVKYFQSPIWIIMSCFVILCGCMACVLPKQLRPANEDIYIPNSAAPIISFQKIFDESLNNKFVIIIMISAATLNTAMVNFDALKNNFYQSKFYIASNIDEPKNNDFSYRQATISLIQQPIAVFGAIITGILIKKFKPSVKKLIRFYVVLLLILMTLFASQAVLSCQKDVKFEFQSTKLNCSSNCDCYHKKISFSPVCLEQTTYFSPCHAGCSYKTFDQEQKMYYYDCNCGDDNDNSNTTAVRGVCALKNCRYYLRVAEGIREVISGFTSATHVIKVFLYLRLVRHDTHKAVILAVDLACNNIFPYLPAKMIIRKIANLMCLHWDINNECLFHRHDFGIMVTSVTCALVAVAVIVGLIATFVFEDVSLYGGMSDKSIPTLDLQEIGHGGPDLDDYLTFNIPFDSSASSSEPAFMTPIGHGDPDLDDYLTFNIPLDSSASSSEPAFMTPESDV